MKIDNPRSGELQPRPDMPAEAPLAMPIRPFAHNDLPYRTPSTSPRDIDERRALLIVATIIVTMMASASMAGVAAANGIDAREAALLILFAPLFAWIAFSFSSALAGFVCLLRGKGHDSLILRPMAAPAQRTAVVMPIHNEDAGGVMARLSRMIDAVAATGHGGRFDFFVLSDSSDPHVRRVERAAWLRLRDAAPLPLYYRLRPENVGRKPGNIADWIRRHGAAYEHMIVLDADSVMSGELIVRLATTMEANSDVALIQTMPAVAGCHTLFARWQQFAARLYSPVAAAGLLWWSGSEASFWGHNAIVRVHAFADCCGMEELPGKAPLGGQILSHDLVEAAMLRRRGWAVHMVDTPHGSYEEFPPTSIDHAIRDRRWCQGNLQHLRLLDAKGFHWISRLQLLMGGSSYLTSPLWLLLLIAGTIQRADGVDDGIWFVGADASWVLTLTVMLLFGPKLMSVAWTLIDARRRAAFGGAERIVASVIVEIPLAILMAPMVMMTQTIMLVDILRGRSAGWSAQRRDTAGLSAREAFGFYRIHMIVGAVLGGAALASSQQLIWTMPVAIGLVLAPLLGMVTSRRDLGLLLARDGLFVTPEERGLIRMGAAPLGIGAVSVAVRAMLGGLVAPRRDRLVAMWRVRDR